MDTIHLADNYNSKVLLQNFAVGYMNPYFPLSSIKGHILSNITSTICFNTTSIQVNLGLPLVLPAPLTYLSLLTGMSVGLCCTCPNHVNHSKFDPTKFYFKLYLFLS